MDNNSGQIRDFWVSRASKQLNMSTSIKIWILMYYIHLDLDTYHIHVDPKIYLLHSFGSQNLANFKLYSIPISIFLYSYSYFNFYIYNMKMYWRVHLVCVSHGKL